MRLALAAMGLLILQAGTAIAQQPDDATREIVVHAEPNPEAIRQFVHNASAEMPSAGQLALWNQRICPGVVGATPATAQALIDQIARRASALGLHVGEPGCRADLTIIVTPQSDRVAQAIFEGRRMTLIDPNDIDGATLGNNKRPHQGLQFKS